MKLYYVTFPDETERQRLTDLAIQERLAGCVNAFPIDSCYPWNGERQDDEEVVAIFKTSEERADDLVARLKEEHPYDVPCILEIPVSANQEYADWISEETR